MLCINFDLQFFLNQQELIERKNDEQLKLITSWTVLAKTLSFQSPSTCPRLHFIDSFYFLWFLSLKVRTYQEETCFVRLTSGTHVCFWVVSVSPEGILLTFQEDSSAGTLLLSCPNLSINCYSFGSVNSNSDWSILAPLSHWSAWRHRLPDCRGEGSYEFWEALVSF